MRSGVGFEAPESQPPASAAGSTVRRAVAAQARPHLLRNLTAGRRLPAAAAGIAQLALYAAYSRGPGPALTAAADGDAAASSEDFVKAAPHLQEPLLQRSVSAGGIPYDDTDLGADAYALLIGVGGGGGGAGGAGARGSGGAAAEDREAAAALAAAALAWKGGAAKPHEEAA